ncbi:MAG TPA: response regulator [Candidatus Tectomicrobia bacterium]|nr:response regulator [Candidatus Tectomicrobia bacterium]
MGVPLQALIVEDREDETLLLEGVLRRAGYDLTYERVDTAEAMSIALKRQPWDIVIADYTMPAFSGLAALALVQERGLDLPFVIVADSIGEDRAVAAMKAGAHDYILKPNLDRLIPTVERELRDAAIRRTQKRAQEALQEHYLIMQAVFEGTSDAIFVKDLRGRYVMINSAGARVFGKSPGEVIGKDDTALIAAELARQNMEHDRQVLTSGETQIYEEVGAALGETRTYLTTKTPHRDHQGHIIGIIGIARDITERKQAEDQLQRQRQTLYQSEKLATMGQLLAGVAHELNNPLSVVMGQAALLQQSVRNKRQMERAEKIVQAAERCARIVNNFLALARQRPPERHPVQVNTVVREAVELLAYPLRVDSVEVVWELAEEVPVLWADAHQLHQVVVNLVANAHQAMREMGGPRRLTVATGVSPGGTRVWMEVRDTGPGIAPELEGRIFEPFFTTKPPGVGTGLGLSLCQGIVEGHGGWIGVVQGVGPGAVFRVELPVEGPSGVEPAAGAGAPVVVQRARILVVDDEPGIAGVLAEVLQLDGHVVEMVGNGEAALGKLAVGEYDLILSDIRMPELDGPSLYWELERRDPRLLQRMIFLTGDTLSTGTREFLEKTGAPCIAKPFALDDVREIVQQVLHTPGCDMTGEEDHSTMPQRP